MFKLYCIMINFILYSYVNCKLAVEAKNVFFYLKLNILQAKT